MELPDSIIGLKWEWFQSEHFGAFIRIGCNRWFSNGHTGNTEHGPQAMKHLVYTLSAIADIPVLPNTDWSQIFIKNIFLTFFSSFFLFVVCVVFSVQAAIIIGLQEFVFSIVQSKYWFCREKHHDDIKEKKISLFCSITLYRVPLITSNISLQEIFWILKVNVLKVPQCMCVSQECVGV